MLDVQEQLLCLWTFALLTGVILVLIVGALIIFAQRLKKITKKAKKATESSFTNNGTTPTRIFIFNGKRGNLWRQKSVYKPYSLVSSKDGLY